MDHSSASTMRSLAMCATFHSFDLTDLQALLVLDEAAAAGLLHDDRVEPVSAETTYFRLRSGHQPSLLDELRRTFPREEPALHRRSFHHFLHRLHISSTSDLRLRFEDACIHHLRALRDLNLDYMRWDEIMALVSLLRAALPRPRPEHDCCLTLIESYHAMRHQEYQHSEALLDKLIADPELVPSLHIEALLTRSLCKLNQAQFDRAQRDLHEALELGAATGDHVAQGGALINMSWIYNELSQYETALQLSQQSLLHFQQGGDLYGTAYALYSIGNNALSLGLWNLGQQHLDQAAIIYDAAGMEMRLATVDWARGLLHQMLGNEALSEAAYLRAFDVAMSGEHGNVVVATDCQIQLGVLYQALGHNAHAAESYLRAIQLADSLHDDLRRCLLLHRYGRLLWQLGDTDAALHYLSSAIDCIESLRFSTEGEEMKIGLLGTTQEVYESIVLALIEQGELETAFAYVERARARAFLDLVARRGGMVTTLIKYRTVEVADLQARLPPDTILLEYYTVGVIPPTGSFAQRVPATNAALRALLTVPPQILLFALTSEQITVHRIAVDPNQLQPPTGDPTPGWHLFTERKLTWLYTKLLAPVAALMVGKRLVHFVPHGPLHYVPFAALHAPNGARLLAADGPSIAYAPSATVLCRCLDQPISDQPLTLVLGYNDRDIRALRYAEHEAVVVGALTGALVHIGPAPKASTLFDLAPHLMRLHIAGHAVFQCDDPLGSFLRLGDGDDVDARTLMNNVKLNGALVTLNACTSGLNHIASGDELLGLPRAFLYAGAATIVCALHEVDDLAAYMLMVLFYENLAHGLTPASALHEAQISLRTKERDEVMELLRNRLGHNTAGISARLADETIPFAHARYWAPFIVIGRP